MPGPISEQHFETVQPLPEAENSLFPIPLGDMLRVRDRMAEVSMDDLRSFIDVRKQGRADNLLTTIYGAGFDRWHIANDEFYSDAALLMYEAGLLYGSQMSLDLAREKVGEELLADDSDAYEVARLTVLHSYDGITSTDFWEREHERELRHTGSDSLGLLNALLNDRIDAEYARLLVADYTDVEIPGIKSTGDLVTFYTGLLDAAIFTNTYARFKKNLTPVTYPAAVESLSEVPSTYAIAKDRLSAKDDLFALRYELELRDNLEQFVREFVPQAENVRHAAMEIEGARRIVSYAHVVNQTGPNQFRIGNQILAIHKVVEQNQLKRWAKIGGVALFSGAISNLPDIGSLPQAEVVIVGSALAAIVGGVIMHALTSRPKDIVDAAPEWEHPLYPGLAVPREFGGPPPEP